MGIFELLPDATADHPFYLEVSRRFCDGSSRQLAAADHVSCRDLYVLTLGACFKKYFQHETTALWLLEVFKNFIEIEADRLDEAAREDKLEDILPYLKTSISIIQGRWVVCSGDKDRYADVKWQEVVDVLETPYCSYFCFLPHHMVYSLLKPDSLLDRSPFDAIPTGTTKSDYEKIL